MSTATRTPRKAVKRIITYTVLGALGFFILLAILASFITDYWWFSSLGYLSVFWTTYQTQYLLWFIGFAISLVWLIVNINIAMRSTSSLAMDPRLEQIVATLGKFLRIAVYTGAVVLALILASALSADWMQWLTYRHAVPVGTADPVFGNDIGFYMFKLPFLLGVKNWLFAVVVVGFIANLLVYLIRQGVSFAFGRISLSEQARTHMSVHVGLFFVLLALHFWLDRYDVLFSTRSGSFFGAGFTDVFAQIPAHWILVVLSIVVGAGVVDAVVHGKVKRGFVFLGAYAAIGILAAAVYPFVIQKFFVDPNEQSKEYPYIQNNIHYTRLAYDLNTVEEKVIVPKYDLTAADIVEDSATVKNIMLWDYRPLASTLDQLQVIRLYYDFPDVDIDRYTLPDGTVRQVMLSARELNQEKLPANARTWQNLTWVYTHGYGLGMSPVNVVTDEGLPKFFIKDIPPVSDVGLKVVRPEIYFGEETRTPVVVHGNIQEFDYPMGDANRLSQYAENAGVGIGSFLKRLVFAMHFGDLNMLISSYVNPASKILYVRNIQDRVEKIAPFLHFDKDPYLVVADGRLSWMFDAYTISENFPYSRPAGEFNYIRNSVKIVIDAYNGSTQFYVFNPEADPIIRVYRSIFPELFKDEKDMPSELRKHVRYPQDLFDIQSSVYELYHMEDPQVFYNKEDVWNIANEKIHDEVSKMESYYAIMRLPGEEREEFILMIPYTPNKRDNMIAWFCARSDSAHYGKRLVYKFPKKELTYGPMQVSARIDQDPTISQQLTLWNQQGSSVTRGNLLVIPIKQEIMYVQPVYLQATTGKLPELKRVIVAFGNRIAMESNLEDAMRRVFGTAQPAPTKTSESTAKEQPRTGTQEVPGGQLSRSALDHYEKAQKALKSGNWARYGEELDLLKKDLDVLVKQTSR
jgi:uncharacterized protein